MSDCSRSIRFLPTIVFIFLSVLASRVVANEGSSCDLAQAAILPSWVLAQDANLGGDEYVALCEHVLADVIQKDRGSELVDREHFEQMLKERRHMLREGSGEKVGRLLAADIYVIPLLTIGDDGMSVVIRALHAPTASLLAELNVPINNEGQTSLDQAFSHSIVRWWPVVLAKLEDVRTKPHWYLWDVTPSSVEDIEVANRDYQVLKQALEANPDVFLVTGPVLTLTQREALMLLVGFTATKPGGFEPSYHFVTEAHLDPEKMLNVLVRDGELTVIDSRSFEPTGNDDQIQSATAWLTKVSSRITRESTISQVVDNGDRRRASVQSRLQFNTALALQADYQQLEDRLTLHVPADEKSKLALPYVRAKDRQRRSAVLFWNYLHAIKQINPSFANSTIAPMTSQLLRFQQIGKRENPLAVPERAWLTPSLKKELIVSWSASAKLHYQEYLHQRQLVEQYRKEGRPLSGAYTSRIEDKDRLRILSDRFWRNIERSSQLDPTWETPAFMLADTVQPHRVPRTDRGALYKNGENYSAVRIQLSAMHRFVDDFPASSNMELVLFQLTRIGNPGDGRHLPPELDRDRVMNALYREGMEAHFEFLDKYVVTGRISIPYSRGDARHAHFGHALYLISQYLTHASPSDQERSWLIQEWGKRFDHRPKLAPGSGFVKLLVLAAQHDEEGCLRELSKLQSLHPDPTKMPWSTKTSDGGQVRIAGTATHEALSKLFRGENDHAKLFHNWLQGKRATKELPWMR